MQATPDATHMVASAVAQDAVWAVSWETRSPWLNSALHDDGSKTQVSGALESVLPPGTPLSAMHVRDLCMAAKVLCTNQRCALHTWLFTLLGGAQAGLQHPATLHKDRANSIGKAIQVRASIHVVPSECLPHLSFAYRPV